MRIIPQKRATMTKFIVIVLAIIVLELIFRLRSWVAIAVVATIKFRVNTQLVRYFIPPPQSFSPPEIASRPIPIHQNKTENEKEISLNNIILYDE